MHTQTAEKTMNGVDVRRLFDTVDAVQTNPELGRFQFRVRNRWIDAGHNRSEIADFDGAGETHKHDPVFVLDNGEHEVLLSKDEGPNPVEYLLHAMAGCITTSLVYHAAAKGIKLTGVRSRFEGDIDLRGFLGIDETVRKGYQQIRVHFEIDGDATDDELEELLMFARDHSPAIDTVMNPVPVEVTLAHA